MLPGVPALFSSRESVAAARFGYGRVSLHAQTRRLRRLDRGLRAQLWARTHPGIEIGRRVQVGRRCRLFLDPGATLLIGDGCQIDDGTTLAVYGNGRLTLGAGSFVGHTCTIAAHSGVTIGEDAFLAELVSVRDHDHEVGFGPSSGRTTVEAVEVGPQVWVGAKATILKGTVIGRGAVLGANCVARGTIPPWTVNVGIPTRVVRTYRPESDEEP